METKQIIIYAIVAFAVYKLFIEKEGFAFRTTDSGTGNGLSTGGFSNRDLESLGGTTSPSHIRMRHYQEVDCSVNPMDPRCPGIGNHIRTRNEGFSHNNQRGAMNFAHSSHIKNHIRSNRKNSMLNGMMYGNQIPCSGSDCPGEPTG